MTVCRLCAAETSIPRRYSVVIRSSMAKTGQSSQAIEGHEAVQASAMHSPERGQKRLLGGTSVLVRASFFHLVGRGCSPATGLSLVMATSTAARRCPTFFGGILWPWILLRGVDDGLEQ